MRILIIGFTKLAYMPYMNFYLEALQDSDAEIHILCWNRDEEPDITPSNKSIIIHEFKKNQPDEIAKITKIRSFLRYRKYTLSIINAIQFDKIIILHTLPAVLINDIILKKYRNKFILDYRDYTYEGFAPFRRIIEKLTEASYATFVSSDSFREVLPGLEKVYTTHNLLIDSLNHRDIRSSQKRNHHPIRLSFWGFIRHESINKQIIKQLGNDDRFELHYYGREQQTAVNLKEYVSQNNIKNVFFHGVYQPEERYDFASQTDIIHNIYENDAGTKRAMGNKYYDGIVFRIPQICNPGSYMGERVIKENTGTIIDPYDEQFSDTLFNYYQAINWGSLNEMCDMATSKVCDEYYKSMEIIKGLIQ